jgi:hypothetical protein
LSFVAIEIEPRGEVSEKLLMIVRDRAVLRGDTVPRSRKPIIR